MTRKQNILTVLVLSGISLGCASAWFGVGAMAGAYWYLKPKLPAVDVLNEARMQQPLRVYTSDGKLLAEFGEKRRIPVEIDQVPERIKQAFLAAEDDRFLEHPGVDYRGIIRAVLNQLLTGDRSQGGSTITMQVAKNFFLTSEKTYTRKLNQIFLALKIERELTKDKILELYLNKIYLGKRAYGVAAAAQAYYGKTLDELNLAQTTMIAGLPKAPSRFNPIANPQRALIRRNYILTRMLELGFISNEDFIPAIAEPITAGTYEVSVEVEAPYLAEMVRAELVERYGEEAYVSGMKVHTTLDSRLQLAANKAIRKGLLDYSERHGYRGPIQVTTLQEGIKVIELVVDESEADIGAEEEFDEKVKEIEIKQPALEMVIPRDPAEVHQVSRSEIDVLIEEAGRFGELRPGYVLEIFEREPTEVETAKQKEKEEPGTNEVARIYLGNHEQGELTFESVRWAKGFISVNEQGPDPKSMRDVLEIGDLVWVRPMEFNSIDGTNKSVDTANGQQIDAVKQIQALRLTRLPEVEGALASLDPQNGAIVSLVGGFDYFKSKFNRVVQARRQPGSGFKPFIYSAALEEGYTTASIINDAPVVFDDPALEGKWRPENYSGRFFGPTRLREGLVKSRNLVSIRLLIAIGINTARNYAKRFGFDDEALPRDLSLALGSGTVSPLRLVSGFSVFANGGHRIEPFSIDRIENTDGAALWYADYELACLQCYVDSIDPAALKESYIVEWPLLDEDLDEDETQNVAPSSLTTQDEQVTASKAEEEAETVVSSADSSETAVEEPDDVIDDEADLVLPAPKRVLRQAPRIMDERVNYIANSMLRDVILRGTGRRALALGRNDLGGKTGTSNDEHDAWFNGFNYRYATSVWVGFDVHQPLGSGEAGSRAALPIWIDFMQEALRGVPEKLPDQPEGLATIRIDSQTGLLATTVTRDSVFEIFRTENVPTEKSESANDNVFNSDADNGAPDEEGYSNGSVTEELF